MAHHFLGFVTTLLLLLIGSVRALASLYRVQYMHTAASRCERPHSDQECPQVVLENLEGEAM